MKVVGLMSGTSVDGVDAALVEISGAPPELHVELLAFATYPWPSSLQERIFQAFDLQRSNSREVCRLNFDVGFWFAKAAIRIVSNYQNTTPDLIACHGQTIWHEITNNNTCHSTLQIGNASIIAERTGITTISDFRSRDVAAGGQGAPLVAYFDWLLLQHPTRWRAVQNIGGMANVTFLPPRNCTAEQLAFDTGPGNALIDAVTTLATEGQLRYDVDGALAAQGTVHSALLNQLLEHEYYIRQPPKTTGRELFGESYAREIWKLGRSLSLEAPDIVAATTALTVVSIARAYKAYAPGPVAEVILGGGGAHNPVLVAGLRAALAPAKVLFHEDVGLNSDAKEAMAFALLAYETWHGRSGNLPSCTGARRAVPLGTITPGQNFGELCRLTWRDSKGAHR